MKKIFFILILIFVAISLYAQRADLSNGNVSKKARRICINNEINKPEYLSKVLENTKRDFPEIYSKMISLSMKKTDNINYQVGDKKDFFVLNTKTSTFETLNFTLKASGLIANIWIDTTEMTNDHVTMTEIDAVLNDLENSTPSGSRNPDKGIMAIDNQYFGDPPNYDGDGKVDFLLCDIKDDFAVSGDYVAGFFYSNDQTSNYGSNKRDILYIDTYPSIYYENDRRLSTVLQTTAHEYQHLIHYRYDKSELTFVNEALSQNAEVICGYDVFNGVKESDYFTNTNISLFDWQGRIADYSRATLWLLYMTEQVGDPFLKKLVQNPQNGLSGISSALTQVSSAMTFQELLANWTVANYYKDKYSNEMFGYNYPVTGRPAAKVFSDPNVSNATDYVYLYASKYIIFNSQTKNFKFKFTSNNGNLRIKLLAFGPNAKKYNDIQLNVDNYEFEFKDKYETLVFVITNIGANPWSDFTLNTSGTMVLQNDEIAYDSGVPQTVGETGVGYLFSTPAPYGGWAVKFNPGSNENRLRKIKLCVGFDQEIPGGASPDNAPKRFQVHIWKAKNDTTPGADLITPFIFQSYRSELSEEFIEIDLSAYKDKLTNLTGPIFAGFLEDDEYPTGLAISNASTPLNYTYIRGLQDDTLWYSMSRLDVEGTSLSGWNAMVRAEFVYYLATGAEQIIDQMPVNNSLKQNYPNPFNPATNIEYSVSENGNVKIVIYDILGRNVKTLVDEIQTKGVHRIMWDGSDNHGRKVAAGVYLYHMAADHYSAVKKLNLIK